MELVYLWVEEYKNIHKQGFNFSPKFNCSYDPDSNALTIDENDDYIENFFGDNINVTAIVGKNGSGKSSVFEVLAFLYKQGLIQSRDDKTFFLFKSNGKFFIQCENYKIDSKKGWKKLFHKIENKTRIELSNGFVHRTMMSLISFSNCLSDMTYNKRLEKLKSYDKFYNGVQPDSPMMKSKNTYDNFNQKFHYILNKKKDFFNFIDEKIIFDNFRAELHINEIGAWFVGSDYEKFIIPEDTEKELLSFGRAEADREVSIYKILALVLISKSESIRRYDHLNQRSNEEDEKYLREHIFNNVSTLFKNESFSEKEYDEVLDICLSALESSFQNLENEVRDNFLKENYDSNMVKQLLKKYKFIKPNIYASEEYRVNEKSIEEIINTELENELLKSNILRINFFNSQNEDYTFLELSSGEKLYLNILTNFTYTLLKLEDEYKGVMLFDEIELSFHPAWQKKIVDSLINIFHKISKEKKLNLHLIFTTHSPFLLSDIPKQNIIFLDKNEEGKCKVVDGLKEKKQTFGANIHTLLSDSFFMEDGLMGEFAKGKINEIIDFHKVVEKQKHITCLKKIYEKRKTKFWQTQSIIGEEYLKQIIKNHLVEIEKILLGKDEAKKQEIERTETYLKSLKND